jgi:hypothetical protein
MSRLRLVLRSLLPAIVLWGCLLPIALWFGAQWPDGNLRGDPWQNFITFFLIVTFLWSKAWLILRRMPYIDWLSVSLATVNFAFCALYLVALLFVLWPHLYRDYPELRQALVIPVRTFLIGVKIWSSAVEVTVPEPIYPEDTNA